MMRKSCERRVGFTKKTAMRHRRVGGRAVTAMLKDDDDVLKRLQSLCGFGFCAGERKI